MTGTGSSSALAGGVAATFSGDSRLEMALATGTGGRTWIHPSVASVPGARRRAQREPAVVQAGPLEIEAVAARGDARTHAQVELEQAAVAALERARAAPCRRPADPACRWSTSQSKSAGQAALAHIAQLDRVGSKRQPELHRVEPRGGVELDRHGHVAAGRGSDVLGQADQRIGTAERHRAA